jgi:hypothetical protein
MSFGRSVVATKEGLRREAKSAMARSVALERTSVLAS